LLAEKALCAEEHKPDHCEDQDREPGRYRQQREHRRSRLGLPRLGGGFDDPAVLCRRHGDLQSPRVLAAATIQEETPDRGRCSGSAPAQTAQGTLDQTRLTPFAESRWRLLESGPFDVILRLSSPVAYRSLPWPPAPTGRVFCGCRS